MSSIPPHPQTFVPAERSALELAVPRLAATLTQISTFLHEMIVSASPRAWLDDRSAAERDAREAYEARCRAAQRLAAHPLFASGH